MDAYLPNPQKEKKPSTKEEELWEAASAGDAARVKALLQTQEEINVNYGDPELQRTPLYRAAGFASSTEVVKLLLSHPQIDVNRPNNKEATPFYIACQEGNLEVVKHLAADERVDINLPYTTGATPLMIACDNGHAEVVRFLLGDPRTNVNQTKKNGTTPLWKVCQSGHERVAKLLLCGPSVVDIGAVSLWNQTTAVERARQRGYEGLALLIEEYAAFPLDVSLRLRKEMALDGFFPFPLFPFPFLFCPLSSWTFAFTFSLFSFFVSSASFLFAHSALSILNLRLQCSMGILEDVFALVLLYCDGFLKLRKTQTTIKEKQAAKFFQIAKALPFDVKMILIRRVYLSSKSFFVSNQTEAALQRVLSHPFF